VKFVSHFADSNIALPRGCASTGWADLLVLSYQGCLWLAVWKTPSRKLRTCLIHKGSDWPCSSEGFPRCRDEELREATAAPLPEHHPSLARRKASLTEAETRRDPSAWEKRRGA